MKKSWGTLLISIFLVSFLSSAAAEVLRLDYEGFTVWLDCDRRGAVKFRSNAQRDQGHLKRHQRFYFDPQAPKRCQQTSTMSHMPPLGLSPPWCSILACSTYLVHRIDAPSGSTFSYRRRDCRDMRSLNLAEPLWGVAPAGAMVCAALVSE